MFDVKKLDNAINSITDKIIEEQGENIAKVNALAELISVRAALDELGY